MSHNSEYTTRKFSFYLLLFFIFVFLSFVVSTRVPELHNDSIRYKAFFDSVVVEGWVDLSDWFFILVNYTISKITDDHEIAFLSFFLIQLLGHFLIIRFLMSMDRQKDNYKLLFYFILCLSSTWFYVSAVDGIRQGISLPFLYLAFLNFACGKYAKVVFFYTVSVLFHSSGILLLPFLWLTKINKNKIFILMFSVSVGYLFGINEKVIDLLSSVLGIPLYSMVKNYSNGDMKFYGFDILFFGYSLFYGFLFHYAGKFIDERYRNTYFIISKIFNIFLIYYFIFGFAAFSNRYAFVPWNLIPLLQTYMLLYLKVKISGHYKLFIYFSVFSLSFILFASKFSMFWL